MSRGRGRRTGQTGSNVVQNYADRTHVGQQAQQNVNNTHSSPFPPLTNPPGAAASNISDPCGTCNTQTGIDAIGCDRCVAWFHPSSSMCLGLPDPIVSNIIEYDGQGIAFICTDCRSKSGKSGTVPDSAFKQLFQTVKKLCETVQTLSAKQDSINSEQDESTHHRLYPSPTLPPPSSSTESDRDHLRTLIREETRELEERSKRKSSIIIRGLDVHDAASVGVAFDPVSRHIVGSSITLSDVTCISRDKKLYRAKILDEEVRKNLLDNTKTLHNTQYSHIYVSRDLTYKQRKELRERRAQRARDGHTQVSHPSPAQAPLPPLMSIILLLPILHQSIPSQPQLL